MAGICASLGEQPCGVHLRACMMVYIYILAVLGSFSFKVKVEVFDVNYALFVFSPTEDMYIGTDSFYISYIYCLASNKSI